MLLLKTILFTIILFAMCILEQKRYGRMRRGQDVMPAGVYRTAMVLMGATELWLLYAIVAWK